MNRVLSRTRESLLFLIAVAVPLSFAAWQVLLNNFAVERAAFTGAEIGVLQSLREVPGLLAFTAVFLLLLVRQQSLAYLSLIFLGLGTAVAGFFPSALGLYVTTVVMSVGFHYLETLNQSLSMQWLPKERAPAILGQLAGARSFATLAVLGSLWLVLTFLEADYLWLYLVPGALTVVLGAFAAWWYPHFRDEVAQHKKLILRREYALYYGLVLLAGARRQIFVVFAGFLMVEKFGFHVENMVVLFLVTAALNTWVAPLIGKAVLKWGEKRALTFEYLGLIGIFVGYAFVENVWLAFALYIADHLLFSMAIAMKTYFQKSADPADYAATAGVSFTINHLVAVILPAVLGVVWITSPQSVFFIGAGFALLSLVLVRRIPAVIERLR